MFMRNSAQKMLIFRMFLRNSAELMRNYADVVRSSAWSMRRFEVRVKHHFYIERTGVRSGKCIPNFLIFNPKRTLRVLVRSASARQF